MTKRLMAFMLLILMVFGQIPDKAAASLSLDANSASGPEPYFNIHDLYVEIRQQCNERHKPEFASVSRI